MEKVMHVMVDLETLSTASNAVILSIGAAAFDPTQFEIYNTYEAHIDLMTTNLQVFDISPSTVAWWMSEDRQDARAYYLKAEKTDLSTALWGFRTWLRDMEEAGEYTDTCVWGNGAPFDNVILRRAYELTNQDVPWKFRNDRCFRTLKSLVVVEPPPEVEPKHAALSDAIWQAQYAQRIFDKLNHYVY